MSTEYAIIIKTDKYAGNFGREMCGFCTGVVGDCNVGEIEAAYFTDDYGEDEADAMREVMQDKADDSGCMRPMAMLDHGGDGLEIFFHDKPSQCVIDLIKERSVMYGQNHDIKILGWTLRTDTTTHETEEI